MCLLYFLFKNWSFCTTETISVNPLSLKVALKHLTNSKELKIVKVRTSSNSNANFVTSLDTCPNTPMPTCYRFSVSSLLLLWAAIVEYERVIAQSINTGIYGTSNTFICWYHTGLQRSVTITVCSLSDSQLIDNISWLRPQLQSSIMTFCEQLAWKTPVVTAHIVGS